MKQNEQLKRQAKENDEYYQLYKKNYEEATLNIHSLNDKLKRQDQDGSEVRHKAEKLAADKQNQLNEFIVLQAKALKMTNTLKSLAAHISTYIDDNKKLRKKLEMCDKKAHLGYHDMTPRPDYREIFKRRDFKHFKDDFLMKILRQEMSSAEVVDQMIDVIKAYEAHQYFTAPQTMAALVSPTNSKPSKTSKPATKKTVTALKQLALENSGLLEGRGSLWGPQKSNAPVDASSRHTESVTPRSSRLMSNNGVPVQPLSRRMMVPKPSKVVRPSSSRSSSSSLDSIASRLSDQDYAAIREIEKGMEDINKDFQKIVNI
jgi:hypothetical protein